MSRLAIAAVFAGAVAVLGSARTASADDKAECSFLEFTATAGAGTIDPDLKPLEKKLKKPPFASWNTFKLLTKLDKTLIKQKSEALTLKTGTAAVILRDRSDKRVNLGLTVDGADGKRLLDAKPDVAPGNWLVIGTNAKDDGHFLALMCN
jgi:hypothetical protein